jgi:hypothetical protein
MSKVCEEKEGDSFFLLKDEIIDQNEEQQKMLKNIISEFKKNKQNQPGKKLTNSYTIKVNLNSYLNNNNDIQNINRNNDDSTSEIRVEKLEDGREKIIRTRYDKNHNIISRKIFYNSNTNNNNSINNNNHIINNNQNRGYIFKATNGFTIETKIETLPNGNKNEIKIIRDENNLIVDVQEDEIIGDNRINHMNNNINIPAPMNYMRPNINYQFSNPHSIPNMMNMRPMNMNMNNFRFNNMNPMMPMNNMNYPNIMNNIPMVMPMPMMNNFGFQYMPMGMPMQFPININRLDQNILNSLPETEVKDASKLDSDNKNCVICLEDFKDNDLIICLPCIHVFHSDCIKSWFNNHNSCPTCKYSLTFENLNSH